MQATLSNAILEATHSDNSVNVSFNETEIERKIDETLNDNLNKFKSKCNNTFFFHRYNSSEELQNIISSIENEIYNNPNYDLNNYPMDNQILSHLKRNLNEVQQFESDQEFLRNNLRLKHYNPVKYAIDNITLDINTFDVDLRDYIFEQYMDKINESYTTSTHYDDLVKNIYKSKQSSKMNKFFDYIRETLINGFTKIITGSSGDISQLYDDLSEKIYNFYQYIKTEIGYELNLYPTREIDNSNMAKVYARNVIGKIHTFINNELHIFIQEELNQLLRDLFCNYPQTQDEKYNPECDDEKCLTEFNDLTTSSDHIQINSSLCNKLSTQTKIEEIETQRSQTDVTLDFIQTLPLDEQIQVDDLVAQYNRFTNEHISKIAFGRLMNKYNNYITKRQTRINKVKVLFYIRIC